MSSPELVASPELVGSVRLEQLLADAVPETETEARLQGLARELRSASVGAPASLRERVSEVDASPSRPRVSRKRLALVAFAAVLAVAAGVGADMYFTGGHCHSKWRGHARRRLGSDAAPSRAECPAGDRGESFSVFRRSRGPGDDL